MKPQRRSNWLWIAVVAIMLMLFGPATLVATDDSDDSDSDWETLQKCYKQGQIHEWSGGTSMFDWLF